MSLSTDVQGCRSCPFNDCHGSNLGCLPDEFDIITLAQDGFVWGCHSSPRGKPSPCQGLLHAVATYPELFPTISPAIATAPILDYTIWFHQGADAAKRAAKATTTTGDNT
jgi:hypothetical protein